MRLGVDVGGTTTDGVVLDDELNVLPLQHFRSIGVGVPGVVDPRSGSVSDAVNLGFTQLRPSAAPERELAVPVQVLASGSGRPAPRPAERTFRSRTCSSRPTAVRMPVLTVDVETVVIGGGLTRLGQRLTSEASDASPRLQVQFSTMEVPA